MYRIAVRGHYSTWGLTFWEAMDVAKREARRGRAVDIYLGACVFASIDGRI